MDDLHNAAYNCFPDVVIGNCRVSLFESGTGNCSIHDHRLVVTKQ